MKLYLISQTQKRGYDTYDSAVVAADNKEDAARIHPFPNDDKWWEGNKTFSCWALHPDQVDVILLGTAIRGTEAGVICASFNAG